MKKYSTYLISGERLGLKQLSPAEATPTYVHWLNDPKVQLYTRRRGKKFSLKDVKDFIASTRTSPDRHYAVFIKDGDTHIGNVFIITIDKENKSAELSIMIGDRSVWGQGYASEAIVLATKLAFSVLKLHRLWAESANPAFNAIMPKLRWVLEGRRREAFQMPRGYRDVDCWSVLEAEIDHK